MEKLKCPKCGEEENFHFNYDYSKKELPVIDVMCNECGETFNDVNRSHSLMEKLLATDEMIGVRIPMRPL